MSLYKHVLCLQKRVAVWMPPLARLLGLFWGAALQRSFPWGQRLCAALPVFTDTWI